MTIEIVKHSPTLKTRRWYKEKIGSKYTVLRKTPTLYYIEKGNSIRSVLKKDAKVVKK